MKQAILVCSIVLFITAITFLIVRIVTIVISAPLETPQIDKTFEFCMAMVKSPDRSCGDGATWAKCLEVFSGIKVEVE